MKTILYGDYPLEELGYQEMHENLLPLVHPGQNALDLGIGTGHSCSPIAAVGLHITGVDESQYLLDVCSGLFTEAGWADRLTVICSEALAFLKANTTKFDLVALSDFLMFQKKSDGLEIVKLAYDTLNPGGYLWITTMSTGDDFYTRLSRCQDPIEAETYIYSSPCGGSGTACFYLPLEIGKYLKAMGAKIIFETETLNSADALYNIVLAQKPA